MPPRDDDVASFVKMALMDLLEGKSAEEYLQEAAVGQNMSLDISAVISTLIGSGGGQQMQELLDWAHGEAIEPPVIDEHATCARIQLYSSFDLTNFADGSISFPIGPARPRPWCESEVCISGGVLHLHCDVTEFALRLPLEGRRLSGGEAPKAVMVFSSAGTGKDASIFEDVVITASQEDAPPPTPMPANQEPPNQETPKRCFRITRTEIESLATKGMTPKRCPAAPSPAPLF